MLQRLHLLYLIQHLRLAWWSLILFCLSFPTPSSFRNLTKYVCLSPMAINARKVLTEYSKINNHANLPERQLRSLQRQSNVNSVMTQEENNHLRVRNQRFLTAAKSAAWGRASSQQHFPVCSPRQQCFHAQGHNQRFFFLLVFFYLPI